MIEFETPWLAIARQEIGQSEIKGLKDNPRILEYLKAISLPVSLTLHDEISWCAAFVNWCLISSGINGTHSPAARSFLNWGTTLKEPKLGCVVILKRGSSTWQGHVGFFVSTKAGGRVTILGGNQSDKVCEENFLTDNILGYRWPVNKK